MSEKLNINYSQLKEMLRKSKTKEVLDILVTQVPQTGIYEAYHREIIIHASDLHELDDEKSINTINPEEYDRKLNQIKFATLRLLDDLKAGRKKTSTQAVKKRMPIWQIALIAFTLIGSLGGVSYFLMGIDEKTEVVTTQTPPNDDPERDWQCPTFRDQANFKVLVLPFQDQNSDAIKPHKLIAQKLDKFCLQEMLPAGAAVIIKDEDIGILVNKEEAEPYIEVCKPNMIVWGTAIAASDNQDVSLNYFINDASEFTWLTDFEEEGFVDTLLEKPTSYLGYQGATYKIEELLVLLKQTIALKTNNPQKVIKLAKETEEIQGEDAQLLSNHILAESYQKVGESDNAIAAYSKALKVDPNDVLALNNRAYLNLKQHNLDAALTDVDRIVVTQQANYDTYIKRAKINEELGNLGEAKEDLEEAKKMKRRPKNIDQFIDVQIKSVDIKIEVLKNTQAPPPATNPSTSTNGGRNPTVTRPIIAKDEVNIKSIQDARKDNQTGDYKEAEIQAIKVLKKEPKNQQALMELVKAKYFQNKNITITELKKSRYLKNIDERKLKEMNDPVLNSILENEEVKKTDFSKIQRKNSFRRKGFK